jgi:hypothetical protein
MRHLARAALCGAALLVAAGAVHATTAVEMNENDLIQQASDIVIGKCIAVQSQWIGRDLVTLASIEVTESLKGTAASLLTVVIPGGADSNRPVPIVMSFPAAPEIREQENVLLFLTPEDRVANGYAIVGFSQGKFSIAENAQGKKVASQNLSELTLQGKRGSRLGDARAVVLADLRLRIQAALAKENAQ